MKWPCTSRLSWSSNTGCSLPLALNDCSMLALPDEFLDAGALPTLHDRYGISAEKMNSRIKAWLV